MSITVKKTSTLQTYCHTFATVSSYVVSLFLQSFQIFPH